MTAYLYAGGNVVSSVSLRQYATDATAGFTYDHTQTIYGVAADSNGNVYLGGGRTSPGNITTSKLDNGGSVIWSNDHGDLVTCVAVDAEGNVYTGGLQTSGVTTRKYQADGTEVTSGSWPLNHGGTVQAIAIDADGNVYTGGAVASGATTRKYDADGSLLWSVTHTAQVNAIAVDSSGNVYTGGVRVRPVSTYYTTRKYNSSGSLQWSKDHGANVLSIAVDNNANIYTGGIGTAGYNSTTTRAYDTDGGVLWTATQGGLTVNGICADIDGNVYTVSDSYGSVTARKYDSTGTEITAGDWPLDHGGTLYACAIGYTAATSVPGLAISIVLGEPFVTAFSAAPALAVPLALGLPSVPDRPAPVFDPNASQIYRLYLTGGSSLLELPMSSLQCRRRLGESTWLTVEIPTYSAVLAAAIAAVATRELVIYAGYVAGGVETSGEMMRATLTEIRNEREGGRGSIQLTGRVIPSTATVTSHTLTGVRQRGQDDSGRRTVTCTVDPRIRPNHTVNDGLYTFTAGSILYRISPAEAAMWIVENS